MKPENMTEAKDSRTAQAQPRCAPATGSARTPFAAKMFAALQRLTKEREPRPCGGFTADDMQWQMGAAFTADETLWEALDELTNARLIRYAGHDEEDASGTCYELVPNDQTQQSAPTEKTS